MGNDVITCGGIASTQYHVTLMKDENTALTPTQPFYIASNSTWTPAAQPATQPPPSSGLIQIFGNLFPGQGQTITQLPGTQFWFVGDLNLNLASTIYTQLTGCIEGVAGVLTYVSDYLWQAAKPSGSAFAMVDVWNGGSQEACGRGQLVGDFGPSDRWP